MPAEISHSESFEAITVPYPAFFNNKRTNRGFMDVRGRPDLAAEIAEGSGSKSLTKLLVRIAGGNCPLFTVGCDLGEHTDLKLDRRYRQVAGGYVQFVSQWYRSVRPQHWAKLCNAASGFFADCSGDDNWDIHFRLEPIRINLDGFNGMTGSVNVKFWAYAVSRQKARNSRERLIAALNASFSEEAVNQAFCENH